MASPKGSVNWEIITSGEYQSKDGRFQIERDDAGEFDSPYPLDRHIQTEWFLYDRGEMVDGYPTLAKAKHAAEKLD